MSTITLTGTIRHPGEAGTPAVGYVIPVIPFALRDTLGNIIMGPGQLPAVALNASGQFSVLVPHSDSPNVSPSGWTLTLIVATSAWNTTLLLSLPTSLGATADIADIAPVEVPPAVVTYLLASLLGQANGVASLDGAGDVPLAQIPNLPASQIASGTMDLARIPVGTTGSTVAIGNDVRFEGSPAGTPDRALAADDPTTTNARTPLAHGHPQSDVTNLVSDLAGKEAAGTAAAAVAGHVSAVNPHPEYLTPAEGDAAYAGLTHASRHAAAGADPVTLTQAQITGLVDALAAKLGLDGGTLSGLLKLLGANLEVVRTDGAGGFRVRVTGGAVDYDFGPSDIVVSHYALAGFTGTQTGVERYRATGKTFAGTLEVGEAGAVYANRAGIDGNKRTLYTTGKNGLGAFAVCGYKGTAGAPAAGDWDTGDAVLATDGWHYCTAGGGPGTWT
jgi:hypothetical protein